MKKPMELTNFTVWGEQWFADGWEGLRRFCAETGIAGVELLASGASEQTAPPADLVAGVHLRSLGNWLPLVGVELQEFGHGAARYRDTHSYDELVQLRAAELDSVRFLRPEYVVWHGCYAPFPGVFEGHSPISHGEYLRLLAGLVRKVLNRAEPECTVCFENCFGVGWVPDEPAAMAEFMGNLSDLPVGVALDVGHFLNGHREAGTPGAACELLLDAAARIRRQGLSVELVHLHWTPPSLVPPGEWERAREVAQAEPGSEEEAETVTRFFAQFDQHKPLVHPLVTDVVEALAARWLVHEMGAMTLYDHLAWLRQQSAMLAADTDGS